MGTSGQTWSDSQADAFFAGFVDAAPEVVARVIAERGGNLAAVLGEERAFGYWDRKMAARAARRAARQQADAAGRMRAVVDASRFEHPAESARLAPLTEASAVLLPTAQVVRLDAEGRRETERFWVRLEQDERRRGMADRIRREARAAEVAKVQGERRQRAAESAWRLGERAFERAQWQAVLAQRAEWQRKSVANQWTAISKQRALEIALAALGQEVPPQGRP